MNKIVDLPDSFDIGIIAVINNELYFYDVVEITPMNTGATQYSSLIYCVSLDGTNMECLDKEWPYEIITPCSIEIPA